LRYCFGTYNDDSENCQLYVYVKRNTHIEILMTSF